MAVYEKYLLARLICTFQTSADEVSKSLHALQSFVASSHRTVVNPRTDHQI